MSWPTAIRPVVQNSRSHVSCLYLQPTAVSIPQKTAVLVMGGITLFVLMYLLKGIFWWTLVWSGCLVAIHAFLRDASMHKDADDAVTMEGEFSINEDSSFLNHAEVSRV